MARVQLQNISKSFPGGTKAVDGVDLDIADREFVVLVGPSGCGKSTTLRMVAGLEEVTGGIIRIGDRVVNDVPPKSRDIAMVFQNYALYPHMTVYNNMAFGLKLRRVPRAEIRQRVTQAAKILDIEHLLDRKPKQLSGGQRQRVAVGRAIVREPAAFLFDEPLSNLDAKLRITTRAELKRLHQRLRTTTIYVTHDQEEAMTLGDRIVVMKDGRIQQADTPLNTYNRPANRFVAGFIGMPPMNFFDGTLRLIDGKLSFVEGKWIAAAGSTAVDIANDSGGELTFPIGGFTLLLDNLSQAVRSRVAGYVGRHIVLGIRPEHFYLNAPAGPAGSLQVRINVVEPLGSEMDVYMNTALHDHVVARVEAQDNLLTPAGGPANGATAGAEAMVFVDLRKVHLFEPGVTGMNLSLETSSPTNEPAHAIA
ncbi:MAG: sn-glycerol-3-phosphate ABC transporter ATP-binding protein UgpC [Tepidisphaeraceae bacterium]|jgi:multiple sugar transport system ATP-binding protein